MVYHHQTVLAAHWPAGQEADTAVVVSAGIAALADLAGAFADTGVFAGTVPVAVSVGIAALADLAGLQLGRSNLLTRPP